MSKAANIRVRRSNRDSYVIPLLIVLFVAAVMAACIAYLWQMAQSANPNYSPPSAPSTPILQAPEESSSQSSAPASESSSSSSSQAESQAVFGQALAESPRVTSAYFDDAVFIGDSITTGLELYDILPNTNVVASVGINLDTILTKEVIDSPSGKKTVLQAADAYSPKKIYIMLGANGLAYLSSEETVKLYGTFVDRVRQENPNAIIYIQSILPIEEGLFAKNYKGTLTNQKIDECNALLMKMAGEKNMYYLDVAQAFKDENGAMPKEATSDGLHFKSEYYTKWVDYLKTHTVTEE